MAFLPRPVTRMILSTPDATASSTPYWMMGLSTSGSISFGWGLVAGRKRVPSPAAGKTALRTLVLMMTSFRMQLQDRAVVAQHALANDLHRDRTLPHQAVMKLQQGKVAAPPLAVIFTQLENLQLAQSVIEIGRVGSPALGLLLGHGRHLIAFVDEECLSLVQSHFPRVHFYPGDKACVAQ